MNRTHRDLGEKLAAGQSDGSPTSDAARTTQVTHATGEQVQAVAPPVADANARYSHTVTS